MGMHVIKSFLIKSWLLFKVIAIISKIHIFLIYQFIFFFILLITNYGYKVCSQTYPKSFGKFSFIKEIIQHGVVISWAGLVTLLTNDVGFTSTRPRCLVTRLTDWPTHITVTWCTTSVNVTQSIKSMLKDQIHTHLNYFIFSAVYQCDNYSRL